MMYSSHLCFVISHYRKFSGSVKKNFCVLLKDNSGFLEKMMQTLRMGDINYNDN